MAVPSQLSPGDVSALRSVMALVAHQGRYCYLELGSYLGGSLQWHLTNSQCDSVLSVDLRSHEKIRDERQIDYRYSTTTSDMLAVLAANNIATDKLICVDGTIQHVVTDKKFQLAFIDAEHTDQAVYHDACCCLELLNENAVLMFHNDWIVYKGIEHFEQYLASIGKKFQKFKLAQCDITVLGLGNWSELVAQHLSPACSDWVSFRATAQAKLGRKT